MSDLIERLKNRQRPTLDYYISVKDTSELQSKVNELKTEFTKVDRRFQTDKKNQANNRKRAQLKKDIAALEKEIEESYIVLTFQALDPDEYEALMAAHPPTKEDIEQDESAIFNKNFLHELAVECCTDPNVNRENWDDVVMKSISKGEQWDLLAKVMDINVRFPSSNLPKELRTTLDSISNSR